MWEVYKIFNDGWSKYNFRFNSLFVMIKNEKLFCLSFLLCSFFYKMSYSEEKKFNYDQHKENLLKKNFY